MNLFNLHTHTNFSDGSSEPETYVKQAIEYRFKALGFSDHAPLAFENDFALKADQVQNYANEIRRLQEVYKNQIEIYLSMEIDYIPGMLDDFSILKNQISPDYIIGSVHLVRKKEHKNLWFTDGPSHKSYDEGLMKNFDSDIKDAVSTFFHQTNEMIVTQKPDIIGHMDKVKMHNKDRYFTEDKKWYVDLIDETLDLVKSSHAVLEVNTRGIYKKRSTSLFPGKSVLKKIKALNIPVTISSDAHKPHELMGYFPETIEILKGLGFKSIITFRKGNFTEIGIAEIL